MQILPKKSPQNDFPKHSPKTNVFAKIQTKSLNLATLVHVVCAYVRDLWADGKLNCVFVAQYKKYRMSSIG